MKLLFLTILLFPIAAVSQPTAANAESAFKNGDLAKAESLFQAYLKSHPNDIKSVEFLGDIAAKQGKWETALKYFTKLKDLRPNVADHQYKYGGSLGMVAKDSNKFRALAMIDDIKAAFEKSIVLDPKHIGARWALIELNLQLPAIVGGSTKKAITYANQLQAISPVDGWLAKGHIAEESGKYQQAEEYYKKAISAGGSKTTYQKLADLYKNRMNQPEKAKSVMATFYGKSKI